MFDHLSAINCEMVMGSQADVREKAHMLLTHPKSIKEMCILSRGDICSHPNKWDTKPNS